MQGKGSANITGKGGKGGKGKGDRKNNSGSDQKGTENKKKKAGGAANPQETTTTTINSSAAEDTGAAADDVEDSSSSSGVTLYCEACDREFTSLLAQEAHLKSHVNCKHPGCQFQASSKVVHTHFESAHGQFSGTGYRTIEVEVGNKMLPFKVLMGTSPEEVQQWRLERRSKYPTKENVEKKEQAQMNRLNNGQLNPSRSNLNVRGKVKVDKNQSSKDGEKVSLSKKQKEVRLTSESTVETLTKDPLEQTTPPSNTNDNNNNNENTNSSLGALLATYGSDSDDNEEEVEEVEGGEGIDDDEKVTENTNGDDSTINGGEGGAGEKKSTGRICQFWLHQGKCRNGDDCNYKHSDNVQVCTFYVNGRCSKARKCNFSHNPSLVAEARKLKESEKRKRGSDGADEENGDNNSENDDGDDAGGEPLNKKTKNKKNKNKAAEQGNGRQQNQSNFVAKPSEPTLLRKLLESEIRRERSLFLQCIRFMVDRDFFMVSDGAAEEKNKKIEELEEADNGGNDGDDDGENQPLEQVIE
jgi:hypothetical protein